MVTVTGTRKINNKSKKNPKRFSKTRSKRQRGGDDVSNLFIAVQMDSNKR